MTSIVKHIKENKKKYTAIVGVSIVCITFGWLGTRNNSYAISVDGTVVAIVKEKEEAQVAFEKVVKSFKEENGVDIAVNEEVIVEHVHSKTKEINIGEQVVEALKQAISYEVEAYEIRVDGKPRAIVESKEIATEILTHIAKLQLPEESVVELDLSATLEEDVETKETVQSEEVVDEINKPLEEVSQVVEVAEALPLEEVVEQVKVANIEVKETETQEENTTGQKIKRELSGFDFYEEVTIRNAYVDVKDIVSKEEAIDILLSNTEETIEYTMQEGDNIWDIAVTNGTTMEHILEMNPQIVDEKKMQIGEVIKLKVPDPVLSIATVEEATFKELIPGEIQYVEFSDLYKDETKVYQEGYDGVKEIVVVLNKINGKEVSRTTIGETVLKEAKIKVIAFGTKEKPAPKPTTNTTSNNNQSSSSVKPSGSTQFMHPLNGKGYISSGYGSRWGSFHNALDFAAPAGTPVYASASGTVIYSGYNSGGYGKLVIIDHGNGYQTYYAHNSSLYVQVGQSVSKGQNIAGVGTTGNSTGNHLHFEIRKNGTPVNPSNYIY